MLQINVTEGQRKLHNVELYKVYPLPDRGIACKCVYLWLTDNVSAVGDILFAPYPNSPWLARVFIMEASRSH